MTTELVPAERLPHWMLARRGAALPIERVRSRIAAYVYGTILVLAALATQSRESIQEGLGAIAVGATTATTVLAHLVAHAVAQQLGRDADERRLHLREEARDIVPILTAGLVPFVMMLLAWWGVLDTRTAQLIAGGWLTLQLLLLGVGTTRVTGGGSRRSALWAGVSLAAVSAIVVALKVTLLH